MDIGAVSVLRRLVLPRRGLREASLHRAELPLNISLPDHFTNVIRNLLSNGHPVPSANVQQLRGSGQGTTG